MSDLKKAPQLGAAHTDVSEYAEGTANLELIQRRQDHLGASILFYHQPVHIVRGERAWLFDADGNRYMDCYNNVASVGPLPPPRRPGFDGAGTAAQHPYAVSA